MDSATFIKNMRQAEEFFKNEGSEILLNCLESFAKASARASIEHNWNERDFNDVNVVAIKNILLNRVKALEYEKRLNKMMEETKNG